MACTRAAPLPLPLPSLSEDRDLLYIYVSIYEAFRPPQQILYIILAEQSRIITLLVQTRARARTPRRNVDVLRFATTPCERVPRYLFYTLLHSLSLSFFAFLLFLAFLESHFILRDIVRTITQTKLNAEIVRRVFFFILVIFIFISIIFIYFYMYYLIIFFRLNLFRIDTEKTSRDSKEGLK